MSQTKADKSEEIKEEALTATTAEPTSETPPQAPKETAPKKKTKYPIWLYVLLIAVVLGIGIGGTLARYIIEQNTEETAAIAYPFITILSSSGTPTTVTRNGSAVIKLSDIAPGDTVSYYFRVSNSSGTFMNETKLHFKAGVEYAEGDIPLDLKLYYAALPPTYSENPVATDLYNADPVGTSNYYNMTCETVQSHYFRLDIEWDAAYDDEIYSSQTATIKIVLDWAQLDT